MPHIGGLDVRNGQMAEDRHRVGERRPVACKRARSLSSLGGEPLLGPHGRDDLARPGVDQDPSHLVGLDGGQDTSCISLSSERLGESYTIPGCISVPNLPAA